MSGDLAEVRAALDPTTTGRPRASRDRGPAAPPDDLVAAIKDVLSAADLAEPQLSDDPRPATQRFCLAVRAYRTIAEKEGCHATG